MGWTINKKITAIKDLLQCFAYRNNVVKIEYVTNFFLGVETKYVINIEDTNGYSINKFLFSTCFDDKNKIESITIGGGNLKGIYSSICKYRSLFGLKVIDVEREFDMLEVYVEDFEPELIYSDDGKSLMGVKGCFIDEIHLQESIWYIHDAALKNCFYLEKISIPDSVMDMGKMVFKNCYNLKEIKLPKSITRLREKCFDRCVSLSQVIIPESVTTIESKAFYGCSSLKNLNIPSNVEYIGWNVFAYTGLDEIIFNTDVQKVGAMLFQGCEHLSDINVPVEFNNSLLTKMIESDSIRRDDIDLKLNSDAYFRNIIELNNTSVDEIKKNSLYLEISNRQYDSHINFLKERLI